MDFHHEKISSSLDLEGILRVLYPQQDKYRLAGAYLISEAGKNENGLDAHKLNSLCKEKNISRATMQKVFVRMRALGMIERRSAKYHVNKEFATGLRRLGDAWKKVVNEKRFEFDDSKIKISI